MQTKPYPLKDETCPSRHVTESKAVSADLSCNFCTIDFAQPSEIFRNIYGLAMHLDCMKAQRILNLKEQLVAKQNELDGAGPVGNPKGNPLPNRTPKRQPDPPVMRTISLAKRKWEEYAEKENEARERELAPKQYIPEIRAGAGQVRTPTVSTLQNSSLHRPPDILWAASLTKRKWGEYAGQENNDPTRQVTSKKNISGTHAGAREGGNPTVSSLQKSNLRGRPPASPWAERFKGADSAKADIDYTLAKTLSEAPSVARVKPGLHVIDISGSDEEVPPRVAPQTFMSENEKKRKPPSMSHHPEIYSPGSSGLSLVESVLKTEDLPSALTQKTIVDPPLCEEQQRLVNTIMTGRNVFYTGSAGCGKSTVLKNFVKRLKAQLVWKGDERKEPKQVDIIAPTGRAALDINGSTSWTYAGWNPDSMKKPIQKLKDAAEHGKWIRKRLRATDVLVIDEISMMENHHLERLNEIMQSARGNTRAFGGVQLVVTGDFCQLPPVKPFAYCYKCGRSLSRSKADTVFTCPNGHGSWHDSEKWAFCSSAWEAAAFEHVNLTAIHRQNDRVFIEILQKCRLGVPFTPQEEELLLQHDSQTGNAVKLFSTRQEVGAVNREAFNRLRSPQRTYNSYDDFRCYNPNLESKGRRSDHDGTLDALHDHRFDPRIDLKQGMVVVLLVNLDQENGLVNGSQGVVMGFEAAEASKMPGAIKKDDKEFSRMGSGPVLTGEHAEVREANIRSFMENAKEKVWPVVLFQNRVTRTIYADCRVTELGDEPPYSLISRTQIPLVAGWAMTVHKSQGMTLNRVVVDLRRSFEEGQMYVALSRARSLEGLRVEGLGKQVGCNERVRRFLREALGVGA